MHPTPSLAAPDPSRHWHRANPSSNLTSWSQPIRAAALHVWLNVSGEGLVVWPSGSRVILRPQSLLWIQSGTHAPASAHWLPGPDPHDCLALTYPNDWLDSFLGGLSSEPDPDLVPLVSGPRLATGFVERPLSSADRSWAHGFLAPHLCEHARLLLDRSRLTEFLLLQLFRPRSSEPPRLSRTQRIARDRAERVKQILRSRLDNPPSLDDLAAAVGCSAPYLSRTFAETEGRTLSLWLRSTRIDRAADLLRSGTCNVSEAAIEVGYRSFSHFSRAFHEEKGMTPSRWLQNGVT